MNARMYLSTARPVAIALATISALCLGTGCGSTEDDPETSGSGGTGGAGASGGVSGGTPAGGIGATGGAVGATGGAAGSSATGGTGGSTPTGAVGTLGTQCSPPAALACAGNYQKLTLVCGASGTWEVNQTCPGDQICDTRPGVNQGTCQDQDPNCLGHEPNSLVCVGDDIYRCDADNTSVELVTVCEGTCAFASCQVVDPCPAGTNWLNCAADCGGVSPACEGAAQCEPAIVEWYWESGNLFTMRLPAASDACACSSGAAWVALRVHHYSGLAMLVVPPAPWMVGELPPGATQEDMCSASMRECIVVSGEYPYIVFTTNNVAIQPRNVMIEFVAEGTTCP